jgi:hypothetical protein
MTNRLLALLLAGVVLVVGLAWGEDGPEKKDKPDGGPPRLKRRKRPENPPPATEPAKKDKDKAPAKDDKQPGKDKEKEAEEDAIVPEDGEGEPEEDEKDVLERISKNMRSVEEKLGNRELGEPTAQQQRDILKDIDSLIRRQQQQGGGGGADQQPQGGAEQNDQDQDQKQQGARQKRGSSQRRMAQKGKQRGGQRARQRRQGRGGRMMAGRQQPQQGGNQPQPRPQPGMGGNQPGRGGKGPEDNRDKNAEMYKDVWGHLPESMRAQMNAYSNPQPFLPRYDDLVKKYYRTIAEQGRKKGD